MTRQVALLRAVNVGRRTLAMADLRRLVEDLGATGVATHLRSGNVVYTSATPADRMAADMAAALAGLTGFEVPVVVRTGAEMDAVVTGNPLPAQAGEAPSRLQVVFLDVAPPADAVAGLEDEDVGDDRIRVRGREIYVWSPGGITGSAGLAALARRRMPVTATARNWRTVARLAAMAAAP